MKTIADYEIVKVGGEYHVYRYGVFVTSTDDIMKAAQEIERRRGEDYGI